MSDIEPTKIDHADQVGHAENVVSAEHVGLVGSLKVMGSGDRVTTIKDLTKNVVVLVALFAMIFNYIDNRHERTALKTQLQVVTDKLNANDQNVIAQLNCARRFQDQVDSTLTETVVTIGELVVAITQVEPGPDRVAAVAAKVTQLKVATTAARKAVVDKTAWNDALNPLPCPI